MALRLGRRSRPSDRLWCAGRFAQDHMRSRRLIALLLLTVNAIMDGGCTVWTRVPSTSLQAPASQEVQVWRHDSVLVLQQAVVQGDTAIHGVNRARHDSSAASVIRGMAEVDSLRIRKVSAGRTVLAGVALGASLFFVFTISGGFYSSGH